MIVPTHRRPNGLDAELDALVAREVDALAVRKARVPNGKAAHDQLAEDPGCPRARDARRRHPARWHGGARNPSA